MMPKISLWFIIWAAGAALNAYWYADDNSKAYAAGIAAYCALGAIRQALHDNKE